jgi:hypothetical protein
MMASRANARRGSSQGKFVFDARYVRAQANEAIRSFFGPLSGVVNAARGTSGSERSRTKS